MTVAIPKGASDGVDEPRPRFAAELWYGELAALKNVVDAVKVLTDECRVRVDGDGWRVAAVDPAHVAMVTVDVSRTLFSKHVVPEPFEMGIDLDKFKEVLKLARPGDTVRFSFAPDGRLVVEAGKLTRKIRLVDTAGMSEPKVPDFKDKVFAGASLRVEDLHRVLSASATVTDRIVLSLTKDRFTLFSPGDGDDVTLRLRDGEGGLTIDFPEKPPAAKARSAFPLDYVTNVLKTCAASTKVFFRIGEDMPIRLDWDITRGGGSDKKPVAHLAFLIAPRMEHDDEVKEPEDDWQQVIPASTSTQDDLTEKLREALASPRPQPVPPDEPEPDDDPDDTPEPEE